MRSFKDKSSKTNRCIIIVTDYQTWASKLQFFINDDVGNNEKTNDLETRVGMFKNMGGNIPGGNLLEGNFPGGNFPGGSLMGGNFPDGSFLGGSFPDTFYNIFSSITI